MHLRTCKIHVLCSWHNKHRHKVFMHRHQNLFSQCTKGVLEVQRWKSLRPSHGRHVHVCPIAHGSIQEDWREFDCRQSFAHTTMDAGNDLQQMMSHLIEAKVGQEVSNRNSPTFEEPTEKGLHKMFNSSWIQNMLNNTRGRPGSGTSKYRSNFGVWIGRHYLMYYYTCINPVIWNFSLCTTLAF